MTILAISFTATMAAAVVVPRQMRAVFNGTRVADPSIAVSDRIPHWSRNDRGAGQLGARSGLSTIACMPDCQADGAIDGRQPGVAGAGKPVSRLGP